MIFSNHFEAGDIIVDNTGPKRFLIYFPKFEDECKENVVAILSGDIDNCHVVSDNWPAWSDGQFTKIGNIKSLYNQLLEAYKDG